jgi:hypothetical protein
LSAFNRRTPSKPTAPPPETPQPQPSAPKPPSQRPWFAGPQGQPREELTPEAVDELVQGWRAGNLAWPKRLLGGEPGTPDCRLSPAVLRRNGL